MMPSSFTFRPDVNATLGVDVSSTQRLWLDGIVDQTDRTGIASGGILNIPLNGTG
jgi:hypothetical protein